MNLWFELFSDFKTDFCVKQIKTRILIQEINSGWQQILKNSYYSGLFHVLDTTYWVFKKSIN